MTQSEEPTIPPFPENDGDKVKLEDYLTSIYNYTVKKTQGNINWYISAALPNKFWARVTRLGAIIFVALGGISPLAIAAFLDGKVSADFVAQISYIFIGIAAFLIGVDKFFGFSASWMRFTTTQISLETLLAKFRYDWAIESVKICDKPDKDSCNPLLTLVKKFVTDVQSKMEMETSEWATDLRNNLIDIEKKTSSSTSKSGQESAKENEPPKIESLTASPPSPQEAGKEVTWTAKANDPDNEKISYRFFLNDIAVTDWQLKNQWVWKIPAEEAAGSKKIEVRVIDDYHSNRSGWDDRKIEVFEVMPKSS